MYRSSSPYGSPYAAPAGSHYSASYSAAPQTAASGPQITPGSITYTTSTGANGEVVYHPFKAVPASYQTPTGIVTGIQWVPAEATATVPANAEPASVDFAEAWSRGNFSKEDQKNLRDWWVMIRFMKLPFLIIVLYRYGIPFIKPLFLVNLSKSLLLFFRERTNNRQRSEEKRRKKEEKESMKLLREKDRYNNQNHRYDNDPDLRVARERDAASLQRRKSFTQGSIGFPGAPPSYTSPPTYAGSERAGAGYPSAYPSATGNSPNMGYSRERKYSTGGTLADQFADMGLDHDNAPLARPRKYSTHEARRMSGNFGIERPPSAYDASATSAGYSKPYAAGVAYSNPSPSLRSADPPYMPAPRPSSPYGTPNYPPAPPQDIYARDSGGSYGARAASPYHRAASPYGRSASPFAASGGDAYPPGHVMEGRPIGQRSRATTPVGSSPGMGYHPTTGGFPQSGISGRMSPNILGGSSAGTLAAPECFARPINAAHPYTPFEPMKIQDMDLFLEVLPRMPVVLQTHDAYNEDWTRLTDDIALAWSGRMPLPVPAINGKLPKRATLVAKLIELWNHSFFERRGVELVLYKGRERRSGQQYGLVDLPYEEYDDDSSSSSSSSEEDDDPRLTGFYGGYPTEIPDGRQRRHATKAEKRRRRKERKLQRKERDRRYSLWLFSLPQGGPGGAGSAYGAPTAPGSAFGTHSPSISGLGGFRGPSPSPAAYASPSQMSSYPGMLQH
ncbi:hypothetical protein BDP27DRAFT_1414361 [Rhodocollybia butyracea]|uniref:Uncharacterized protein n=1 Tax=Rhodocollybia butyracea TaxID=206335 RepID=A0A9P5UER1_9AGAR|nr:hypothetical protein BDP27DRAFT_1414361 [Rhodocollybia butyracea]